MAGRARGQDEANPSFDWLTEQVRWAHLIRSGWLDISFLLFFAFSWTETMSRSIKTEKKELGQYSADDLDLALCQ